MAISVSDAADENNLTFVPNRAKLTSVYSNEVAQGARAKLKGPVRSQASALKSHVNVNDKPKAIPMPRLSKVPLLQSVLRRNHSASEQVADAPHRNTAAEDIDYADFDLNDEIEHMYVPPEVEDDYEDIEPIAERLTIEEIMHIVDFTSMKWGPSKTWELPELDLSVKPIQNAFNADLDSGVYKLIDLPCDIPELIELPPLEEWKGFEYWSFT